MRTKGSNAKGGGLTRESIPILWNLNKADWINISYQAVLMCYHGWENLRYISSQESLSNVRIPTAFVSTASDVWPPCSPSPVAFAVSKRRTRRFNTISNVKSGIELTSNGNSFQQDRTSWVQLIPPPPFFFPEINHGPKLRSVCVYTHTTNSIHWVTQCVYVLTRVVL